METSAAIRPSFWRRFDQAGIGLAGLCALHCLLAVGLVSLLGIGGQFLTDPIIHRVGMLLALVVAAVAIGWGAVRHRRRWPIVTATLGLGFMAAALVVPHGLQEFVLTLIGVGLVTLAHLMNLRTVPQQ